MHREISPCRAIHGSLQLPGDKSISHRYAMLASVAEGESRIQNYSPGADCASTLSCLRLLGTSIEQTGSEVVVRGEGLYGWQPPAALDAGNSGSTIRMLSGMLAAQPFRSTIGGDESLSKRPMDRVMRPLAAMGARIEARDGRYPPLDIAGGPLQALDYSTPMASAQVKTCVLFAGLFASGRTTVRESVRTRDHSEIALREFGAGIEIGRGAITVEGGHPLHGCELAVPGDLSSAAFFLVAAMIIPGSELVLRGVGLNPTRSALLDFLVSAGAEIKVLNLDQVSGELVGDILVRHARQARGGVIEKSLTASLIDEIPVLAVMGAASSGGLVVRDAAELRVKESDRIATVAGNLRRMGVTVNESPDGFEIPGNQAFHAAELDSFGDHRVGMSAAVAALAADGPCLIRDAGAASVSFPGFWDTLRQISE